MGGGGAVFPLTGKSQLRLQGMLKNAHPAHTCSFVSTCESSWVGQLPTDDNWLLSGLKNLPEHRGGRDLNSLPLPPGLG